MTNDPLPPARQYYADRSRDTHRAACDRLGNVREEQLDGILDSIATGRDFTPDLFARLERLPWNRAKKHRRLQRTLRRLESARERSARRPSHDLKEYLTLDAEHLQVERLTIAGDSYPVIARRLTTTVGALKMRVSRWRQAVRAAHTE